jgi:hypothetical protein
MIEKVAELGNYWKIGQTFGVLVVVNVVSTMMDDGIPKYEL